MTDPTWRPPGWASKPAGGPRYLLISKDGVSAGKPLTLADRAMLFGRKVPNEPERGTVRLDHDSISRQHAAVVHSFTGETFVVDLGSRFGTAVDGEKLVPQKYTPIKDGAVLVFGASTRAYTFAVRLPKEAAGAPGAAGPPPTTATLAGAAGPSTDARPGLSGHGRRPPAGAVDNDDVDPMANYVSDTGQPGSLHGPAAAPPQRATQLPRLAARTATRARVREGQAAHITLGGRGRVSRRQCAPC